VKRKDNKSSFLNSEENVSKVNAEEKVKMNYVILC
jgi:hypothetical protein